MERFLFVKLKHIGDALILTPVLAATRRAYPKAEIWVAVRKGSEGILKGCTAIDRVLTTAAPEPEKRSRINWLKDFGVLREIRADRFDYVFEMGNSSRGRWLTVLSGATHKAANTFHEFPASWGRWFDSKICFDYVPVHQVEKDYRLVNEYLKLEPEIPGLQYAKERADFSFAQKHNLTGATVVHPATRWKRKQWPLERWVKVCQELQAQGQRLVLSCGPDAEEVGLCAQIQEACSGNIVSTQGKCNWAQLAGILYGARMFLGVDTAAMHLAAACQTPTVAMFGPSLDWAWKPWKVKHVLVTPDAQECGAVQADGGIDYTKRVMSNIRLEQVLGAVREMEGAGL